MNERRTNHSMVLIPNKGNKGTVMVSGGINLSGEVNVSGGVNVSGVNNGIFNPLDTVEYYDLESNSWYYGLNMKEKIHEHQMVYLPNLGSNGHVLLLVALIHINHLELKYIKNKINLV